MKIKALSAMMEKGLDKKMVKFMYEHSLPESLATNSP